MSRSGRANAGQKLAELAEEQRKQGICERYTREQLNSLSVSSRQRSPREHDGKVQCLAAHGEGCTICTTCHFCRQRCVGDMTRCSRCQGARGIWCDACLDLRIGENVDDVLRNESWECPACRGICNCSGEGCLRKSRGWIPTGQLAFEVRQLGLRSVAHYIIPYFCELNGFATDDEGGAERHGRRRVVHELSAADQQQQQQQQHEQRHRRQSHPQQQQQHNPQQQHHHQQRMDHPLLRPPKRRRTRNEPLRGLMAGVHERVGARQKVQRLLQDVLLPGLGIIPGLLSNDKGEDLLGGVPHAVPALAAPPALLGAAAGARGALPAAEAAAAPAQQRQLGRPSGAPAQVATAAPSANALALGVAGAGEGAGPVAHSTWPLAAGGGFAASSWDDPTSAQLYAQQAIEAVAAEVASPATQPQTNAGRASADAGTAGGNAAAAPAAAAPAVPVLALQAHAAAAGAAPQSRAAAAGAAAAAAAAAAVAAAGGPTNAAATPQPFGLGIYIDKPAKGKPQLRGDAPGGSAYAPRAPGAAPQAGGAELAGPPPPSAVPPVLVAAPAQPTRRGLVQLVSRLPGLLPPTPGQPQALGVADGLVWYTRPPALGPGAAAGPGPRVATAACATSGAIAGAATAAAAPVTAAVAAAAAAAHTIGPVAGGDAPTGLARPGTGAGDAPAASAPCTLQADGPAGTGCVPRSLPVPPPAPDASPYGEWLYALQRRGRDLCARARSQQEEKTWRECWVRLVGAGFDQMRRALHMPSCVSCYPPPSTRPPGGPLRTHSQLAAAVEQLLLVATEAPPERPDGSEKPAMRALDAADMLRCREPLVDFAGCDHQARGIAFGGVLRLAQLAAARREAHSGWQKVLQDAADTLVKWLKEQAHAARELQKLMDSSDFQLNSSVSVGGLQWEAAGAAAQPSMPAERRKLLSDAADGHSELLGSMAESLTALVHAIGSPLAEELLDDSIVHELLRPADRTAARRPQLLSLHFAACMSLLPPPLAPCATAVPCAADLPSALERLWVEMVGKADGLCDATEAALGHEYAGRMKGGQRVDDLLAARPAMAPVQGGLACRDVAVPLRALQYALQLSQGETFWKEVEESATTPVRPELLWAKEADRSQRTLAAFLLGLTALWMPRLNMVAAALESALWPATDTNGQLGLFGVWLRTALDPRSVTTLAALTAYLVRSGSGTAWRALCPNADAGATADRAGAGGPAATAATAAAAAERAAAELEAAGGVARMTGRLVRHMVQERGAAYACSVLQNLQSVWEAIRKELSGAGAAEAAALGGAPGGGASAARQPSQQLGLLRAHRAMGLVLLAAARACAEGLVREATAGGGAGQATAAHLSLARVLQTIMEAVVADAATLIRAAGGAHGAGRSIEWAQCLWSGSIVGLLPDLLPVLALATQPFAAAADAPAANADNHKSLRDYAGRCHHLLAMLVMELPLPGAEHDLANQQLWALAAFGFAGHLEGFAEVDADAAPPQHAPDPQLFPDPARRAVHSEGEWARRLVHQRLVRTLHLFIAGQLRIALEGAFNGPIPVAVRRATNALGWLRRLLKRPAMQQRCLLTWILPPLLLAVMDGVRVVDVRQGETLKQQHAAHRVPVELVRHFLDAAADVLAAAAAAGLLASPEAAQPRRVPSINQDVSPLFKVTPAPAADIGSVAGFVLGVLMHECLDHVILQFPADDDRAALLAALRLPGSQKQRMPVHEAQVSLNSWLGTGQRPLRPDRSLILAGCGRQALELCEAPGAATDGADRWIKLADVALHCMARLARECGAAGFSWAMRPCCAAEALACMAQQRNHAWPAEQAKGITSIRHILNEHKELVDAAGLTNLGAAGTSGGAGAAAPAGGRTMVQAAAPAAHGASAGGQPAPRPVRAQPAPQPRHEQQQQQQPTAERPRAQAAQQQQQTTTVARPLQTQARQQQEAQTQAAQQQQLQAPAQPPRSSRPAQHSQQREQQVGPPHQRPGAAARSGAGSTAVSLATAARSDGAPGASAAADDGDEGRLSGAMTVAQFLRRHGPGASTQDRPTSLHLTALVASMTAAKLHQGAVRVLQLALASEEDSKQTLIVCINSSRRHDDLQSLEEALQRGKQRGRVVVGIVGAEFVGGRDPPMLKACFDIATDCVLVEPRTRLAEQLRAAASRSRSRWRSQPGASSASGGTAAQGRAASQGAPRAAADATVGAAVTQRGAQGGRPQVAAAAAPAAAVHAPGGPVAAPAAIALPPPAPESQEVDGPLIGAQPHMSPPPSPTPAPARAPGPAPEPAPAPARAPTPDSGPEDDDATQEPSQQVDVDGCAEHESDVEVPLWAGLFAPRAASGEAPSGEAVAGMDRNEEGEARGVLVDEEGAAYVPATQEAPADAEA